MHRPVTVAGGVALLACLLPSLPASSDTWTRARALALARERGPRMLEAATGIEAARGRLDAASAWLAENPVVDGGAGRRDGDDGDTLDANVGVMQTFELAGQRGARVDAAEAALAGAEAARDETLRALLRDVGVGFERALHAQEGVALAVSAEGVADALARVAERRHRADDVPILDVNVSRAALAGARAQRGSAEAAREVALADLQRLLGLDSGEVMVLARDAQAPRNDTLADLLARSAQRSDLRALAAELASAEAELRLARREVFPDVGLGARYERDDRADVVLGEAAIALPLFDRGQAARADASARVRRLRLALESTRREAGLEVRTAFQVHALRAQAAAELERQALPLLDENEALARRSYEAGEMSLGELLGIRRETLETRREALARRLDAEIAAVELEAAVGGLE